jgi:hypothetical protein
MLAAIAGLHRMRVVMKLLMLSSGNDPPVTRRKPELLPSCNPRFEMLTTLCGC